MTSVTKVKKLITDVFIEAGRKPPVFKGIGGWWIYPHSYMSDIESAASAISTNGYVLEHYESGEPIVPLKLKPCAHDHDAMRDLEDLERKARLLRSEMYKLEYRREDLAARTVANHLGLSATDVDISVGEWYCDTSPIGICAYNCDEDPAEDDCLFCRNPRERK